MGFDIRTYREERESWGRKKPADIIVVNGTSVTEGSGKGEEKGAAVRLVEKRKRPVSSDGGCSNTGETSRCN
jgi:hypothetical protein